MAYLVVYLDSDSLGRIFSIETPTKKVYKHLKTQKKPRKFNNETKGQQSQNGSDFITRKKFSYISK